MLETVLPNLYRLEIPLPFSALRAVNSYIMKGPERSLVIDTGVNLPECAETMYVGLKKLGIPPEKVDFFITHVHTDHIGLLESIAEDCNRVYFNKVEENLNDLTVYQNKIIRFFLQHGFPEQELAAGWEKYPSLKCFLRRKLSYTFAEDGTIIKIGKYRFRCIATPGHSPAHMCLYEETCKLLISGDHILFDIAPNILVMKTDYNPLGNYFTSLEKIYELEINTVLPGHGTVNRQENAHRPRIIELQRYHNEWNNQILSVMEPEIHQSAYNIAALTYQNMYATPWDKVPPAQKFFTVSETLSHLKYMESRDMVACRCDDNGNCTYILQQVTPVPSLF